MVKVSTAAIKTVWLVPLELTVKVKDIGSAHFGLMRLLLQKANLGFQDVLKRYKRVGF